MGRQGGFYMADEKKEPGVEGSEDLPKSREALEAEVKRLRARLRDVEDERTHRASAYRDLADEAEARTRRASREISRVVRGWVLAQLEGVRLTTDLVSDFARNMTNLGKPSVAPPHGGPREARRGATETTAGIRSSASDAMDRAWEIPEKMLDKFYETYKQA
jgi:hypothetical protein